MGAQFRIHYLTTLDLEKSHVSLSDVSKYQHSKGRIVLGVSQILENILT
jgi:hypothetical protein